VKTSVSFEPSSLTGCRIFVAGVGTPAGAALPRILESVGADVCGQGIPAAILRDGMALERVLMRLQPTHVIVAAGRSGGITANRRAPADLMVDNLQIVAAVVPAAHRCGVQSLLYLASSCTYPRECAQPMQPSALWSAPLEPTSEAYATAKLAGLMLCRAYRDQYGARFISAIAGDVYGPDDNFDPEESHVVAGLIRRMHEARMRGDKTFVVWGTGRQVRDLIYTDDLAEACVRALERYDDRAPINLSSGAGTSIGELAAVVRDVVGFEGSLVFDTTRPDGTPVKVLDATVIREHGFVARTPLRTGIERTYAWFLEHGEHGDWRHEGHGEETRRATISPRSATVLRERGSESVEVNAR
jgi:GDP-L-fucose synthase